MTGALVLTSVLNLRRWLELLDSELDYGYKTTPQPRGNSHILHSRARVLGGCSSHNTLISFLPFPADLDAWRDHYGCSDWDAASLMPYALRLKMQIQPIAEHDRNHVVRDWVAASSAVTSAPVMEDMNAQIAFRGGFQRAVGFFNIAYNPYDGSRSSASVAYMHPIMPGGRNERHNLHLYLDTWVSSLRFSENDPTRVVGANVERMSGPMHIRARREVILCAGAFDTPRLLLLSGIGPRRELEALGITCRVDSPGVGEHLQDHPESIVMWETRNTPRETVMSSDACLFVRVLPLDAEPHPHPGPDLMFHIYQIPFTENTARAGYDEPEHAICMTPNVMRSRGSGKLSLASSKPSEKPLINFRYFEDQDRYDERIIVEGVKLARSIAAQEPFRKHLVREVAPGPECETDEQISAYARKVHHTVYHPAGTCRMGTPVKPGLPSMDAVVDQKDLRVLGTTGLRVCDASVLPSLPSLNPMLTVLMVAERGADLVARDAWVDGYRRTQW